MTTLTPAATSRPDEADRGAYRLTTVPTLDAVGERELDSLTANRTFYVSRPWLRAVELQHRDRTAYVICRDRAGTLRGVCPLYWGIPSSRGFYDAFGHFLHRSGGEFDLGDWSPAHVIGSRAGYSCEFLVDPATTPNEQREVLDLLLHTAQAHAREAGAASLSALYLNERGAAQLRDVLPAGQECYVAGAGCVLDVRWSSMDEYVRAMGRDGKTIRREMRVFASKGYTIVESRLGEWVDIAAGLFAQLERRYGHEDSAEDEAVELRALAECADEHSRVLAIRDGARVIGLVLLFLWDGVVYVRSAGFDYAAMNNAFEYFNLGYYETIRFAIRHGYRQLDFGMATYRAKLARGVRLEPLWGVSMSRTADSPLAEDTFAAWDRDRRAAVHSADPSLLERAQLP
ncbi:MAG TPA: GNAT family N-acetyltransferase [Pseudonocardiaceae bacterium]|jgi:hypothetical protein|nr:GNAT family N-acetyltransferase [Pseudonocardiaceae bacterium]